jgi:hypothetical protein
MPDAGFLGEQSQATAVKAPEAPAVEVPEGEDEVALAERQALQEMKEGEDYFLEKEAEDTPTTQATTASARADASTAPVASSKDEVTLEVETILEDGLRDYFQEMPTEAKERFRTKGAEVSTQISDMVRRFQVHAEKVLRLIKEWLLTIPGINKFFLEQEAKIKTDRILELQAARRDGEPPST